MEISNMKNMLVLRNLPSNIVEEAFVVIKANKKIKKLEKVENIKKIVADNETKKDKEYMLKEAEMLVTDYISKIENEEKEEKNKVNEDKIRKFKKYAYISTLIAVIEGVILFSAL